MIELTIPNKEILNKNYVKEFKYGAINMDNSDQETLRNIKIGEKIEIIINLPFVNVSVKTKGRISFISKKSIVFSFENSEESIELKNKIESILIDQKYNNNNIYQ